MSIVLNCDCDCAYPSKTLAELKAMVFDGLGFQSPITTAADSRNRGQLRASILDQLGIADPFANVMTRTLSELKTDLGELLGFGTSSVTLPPGFAEIMRGFLNDAQQSIFRRLELDKGLVSIPPFMELDTDATTLDYLPILDLATGQAKAHYGQQDAKLYLDKAEKWIADYAQRNPPNITAMINEALASANFTAFRRTEAINEGGTLLPFTTDPDLPSADAQAVYLLALAHLKAKIGQPDAKLYSDEYERLMQEKEKRSPPNAKTVIARLLKQAQEVLYRRYHVFRLERWYTWTLVEGIRFYGIGENDELAPAPTFTPTATGTLTAGTYEFRVAGIKSFSPLVVTPYAGATQVTAAVTGSITIAVPPTEFIGMRVFARNLADGIWRDLGQIVGSTWDIDVPITLAPTGTPPTDVGCSKTIDPRHVSWVGVSNDDNTWQPLRKGVPPELYGSTFSAIPTHYDIRQCIEVWPAPSEPWKLRIKGEFGLLPFEADSDATTVDWQAVYLQALADAKLAYKQPDAQSIAEQARLYVADLVAGSHMTARYWPGKVPERNATRPVLA